MCGIYLSVGRNLSVTDEFENFNKLQMRGPDNSIFKRVNLRGFDEVTEFVFGFHRLSINDLTTLADQPFYASDGSFAICNGEIYNSKDLKRAYLADFSFLSGSDCEVVLPLYQLFGLSFVDKLEGEFSIIIYDAQNDKFVFARDSVGVRPLYYAYSASNKSLQVASELKAMSSPGVKHFPPGYVATVDSDFNLNLNKYHDCILIAKNKNAVSFATVTKNIGDALYKAVDRRMCSDVPLGCFLSGGLDSSGVAALAASMYRHPIRTFTLRIDGLHNEDAYFARKVSKHIGSEHHEIVTSLDEIFSLIDPVIYISETYNFEMVPNLILIYLVARYVANETDVKVILDGTGPDEMLGGYWFFKSAPTDYDFENETIKQLSEMHRTELLGERVVSHFGLEARYPYLDREVQRALLTAPADFKTYKSAGEEKLLLRKALEPFLPIDVAYRKKLGMTHGAGSNFENIFDQEIRRRIGTMMNAQSLSHDRIVGTEGYYQDVFYRNFPNAQTVECGVTPAHWRQEDPLAIWR